MRLLFALSTLLLVFTIPISVQNLKTENVIPITMDGLRIQELFGGVDETILNDKEKSEVNTGPILALHP